MLTPRTNEQIVADAGICASLLKKVYGKDNEDISTNITNNSILRDFITSMRVSGKDPYCMFDYLTCIEEIQRIDTVYWEEKFLVTVNHHDESLYKAIMSYDTHARNTADDDDLPPMLRSFELVGEEYIWGK